MPTLSIFTLTLLSGILLLSSAAMLLLEKPIHAVLSFLVTLLTLAAIYLALHAEFVSLMQVLLYGGAIMVIFMFVILLFQDISHAHPKTQSKVSSGCIFATILTLLFSCATYGMSLTSLASPSQSHSSVFGTVESLGRELYTTFFIPFELLIPLFLTTIVGVIYIARRP